MKNKIILILTLILILSTAPLSAATTVEVTEAIREDISLDEIVTGQLTPFEKVNIPAQIGGVAEEVNVEIGDEVEAGYELIKMEQDTLLIQKRQAEASLESAQANYDELITGATEEELTRARSSYEDAKAALESAEINYNLMQEIFEDRRSLEQQLVNAEQQLQSSRQSYRQAEINYEQAKRSFERSEQLFQDNIISKQEYENAEDAYENAETSLNQAESALNSAERNYQLTKETFNNPTELKQQLENARSQLNSARTNLAVSEANLREAERGPREERIRAGAAQLKQAEAGLDELEDNLRKTIITAPFDGLVFQVNVEKGEMIGSGQAIINLINIDQLYVEIELTASAVSRINKGDMVEVKAETMQHYVEGEITNIAPQADPSTRSFLVKVKIDNSEHSLRPGMFADVRLLKGEAGDAVVVPIESIMDLTEETPYLYVVEEGRAVRREVEVGLQTDTQAEIISGLEAGESVIIRGQQRLEAGVEVEVISR
ncbi:efflux RND transporter periplasmic adaptor subunit [Halanaerobium sp. Z-7514]|uniref:Efflux RND transporter periplasmic adaptor subunit n=1 Tax=Halanaerobium polyolivorans TaxID=2886943 RepID=A0AAW4WWZ7_9FIRM|nr:efflux RND transporter periplasmic adaptor subunit [Halanaerobium polyolivorans]MCC3144431.1 efflux RND transporter periplasmic adaptor subunit [Halanaerobium polyolivorans]RQD69859.1 MAG: efflux RND transporter periplasmic adaptor subunit [Halanaerobium sp. MSAO_Bac5]